MPETHPLCYRIQDALLATGQTNVAQLSISQDAVAAAANEARLIGSPDVTEITVKVEAVLPNGWIKGRASRTITVDVSGRTKLRAMAGQTEWLYSDSTIRLAAALQTCVNNGVTPTVAWSWRVADLNNWTIVSGQTQLRMRMPVASLNGKGSYVFRAVIVGNAASEANFNVDITGSPPPTAMLAAPQLASPGCDLVLDASGSTDPTGATLAFSWSCLAVSGSASDDMHLVRCQKLVLDVTSSLLWIRSGNLSIGIYTIAVRVQRSDASATATAVFQLADTVGIAPPVVAMPRPVEQVSPRKPLKFRAVVVGSGTCQPPAWEAWWLLPATAEGAPMENTAVFVSNTNLTIGSAFAWPAPLPVAAGRYVLRLVLSDSPGASWTAVAGHTFTFTSASFHVAAPPYNGFCRVSPSQGNISSTLFTLQSLNWNDDNPPLQYRFSWRRGPQSDVNSSVTDWIAINSWTLETDFRNMLWGEQGTVTINAEAMDALGLTSSAYSQVQLVRPTTPASDGVLTNVLELVAAGGDPYATVAAVSAIAATASNAGASVALATKLLDVMENGGGLLDPTSEVLGATSSGLRNILNAALVNSARNVPNVSRVSQARRQPPVDVGVANQAAKMVGNVARAAMELPEGLNRGTANQLTGCVGTLLGSVQATNSAASSAGRGRSLQDAATVLQQQEALSTKLRTGTQYIGDAVMKAVPAGSEVIVDGGAGLTITLLNKMAHDLQFENTTVGGFHFPPLQDVFSNQGRRLSTCATDRNPVGLHYTIWPSNPFAYAGAYSQSNLSRPPSLGDWELNETCCSVDEDHIVSMDLRLCGNVVPVRDLSEGITFELAIPRQYNDTLGEFVETRICQYFDETVQEWTSNGCSVLELYDDRIVCSCTHLSTFTGAWGNITAIIEDAVVGLFLCANVKVLSTDSLAMIFQGSWWYQPGGVALWCVILVLLVIGFLVRKKALECGISREEVMLRLSAQKTMKPEILQRASWNRMKGHAKTYKRSWTTAVGAYQLQKGLVGSNAAVEEHMMKSPFEGFLVATMVKGVQMLLGASLGVFDKDLEYLLRWEVDAKADGQGRHAASEGRPRALDEAEAEARSRTAEGMMFARLSRLRGSFSSGLEQHREDFIAGTWQPGCQIWSMLLAFHPIVNMMRLSMTVWWSFKILTLACAIFGTMALSALLLENWSYHLSSNNSTLCMDSSFWVKSLRDMLISILASIVSSLPPLVLLALHRRPLPYIADPHARQKRLASRTAVDVGMMVLMGAYLCLCFLLVASFLANVRLSDGNHWLVSTLFLFFKSWVLVPLVVALGWQLFSRMIARSPTTMQKVGHVIDSLLQELPRDVDEVDSRPPWMRWERRRAWQDGGDTRNAQLQLDFREWAQEWVNQNNPPRPSPLSGARATEQVPKPPPRPRLTSGGGWGTPVEPFQLALEPPVPFEEAFGRDGRPAARRPSQQAKHTWGIPAMAGARDANSDPPPQPPPPPRPFPPPPSVPGSQRGRMQMLEPPELPDVEPSDMPLPERVPIEDLCEPVELEEDPHFRDWAREWSNLGLGAAPQAPPPPPPRRPSLPPALSALASSQGTGGAPAFRVLDGRAPMAAQVPSRQQASLWEQPYVAPRLLPAQMAPPRMPPMPAPLALREHGERQPPPQGDAPGQPRRVRRPPPPPLEHIPGEYLLGPPAGPPPGGTTTPSVRRGPGRPLAVLDASGASREVVHHRPRSENAPTPQGSSRLSAGTPQTHDRGSAQHPFGIPPGDAAGASGRGGHRGTDPAAGQQGATPQAAIHRARPTLGPEVSRGSSHSRRDTRGPGSPVQTNHHP